MLTKTKLNETLASFPEEFSIDDLIERLILIDKIERVNSESLNGKTISENELELEMQKWFK
jgi:hypothetical protein